MTGRETGRDRADEAANRAAILAVSVLGLAVALFLLAAPGARRASAGIKRCTAPETLTALGAPLPRTARRLAEGKGLTIVALGSSSTYGTGASRPDLSYPRRLASLLQARIPAARIRVLNRGVGGELGANTQRRIAADVLPEKPDLVIWQVGTNDVLHDLAPERLTRSVRRGISQIKRAGADVILMDIQYAPAVLRHAGYRAAEHALWIAARMNGVALFRRFALMRDWAENGNMKIASMVGPDHLHMTDVSYDCLARQLSASILRDTQMSGDIYRNRG